MSKIKKTFLQNELNRLDDADWYSDLAIIRNKVAFDSFFLVCSERNSSILGVSCSKFVHH